GEKSAAVSTRAWRTRYTDCVIAGAGLVLLVLIAQGPAPTTAEGWETIGWRALRAGSAEEASNAFAQALRVDGADALALLGAGAAANMRGRTEETRQYLAGALKDQPSPDAAPLLHREVLLPDA